MGYFSEPGWVILAAFILFFFLAAGTVLVLWVVMPFSVFSLKRLMEKSLKEQEKTNRLLRSILETNLYREGPYKENGEIVEKRENTH